jgi:hypothetical protein
LDLQRKLRRHILEQDGNIVLTLFLRDTDMSRIILPETGRQPRNAAHYPGWIRFTASSRRHTSQPRRSHLATRKGRSGRVCFAITSASCSSSRALAAFSDSSPLSIWQPGLDQ